LAQPYSILLLATAFICIFLAFYSLRYVHSSGAVAYSCMMLLLANYSIGYAFELHAAGVQQMLFWLNIEYISIAFLPPVIFVMSVYYTGLSHLFKFWMIVPMLVISTTTLLLQVINYDHLFYEDFTLNIQNSYMSAIFKKGPWYRIHQIYANILLLSSSILYLRMTLLRTGLNRIRALIMLLALDIPWIICLAWFISGGSSGFDICPFSLSITGILTARHFQV
jgi:hypothetical protein